ncbi:MAG TPA: hypothetical protein DIW64_00150 [Cellvibrio sp.]|nr:hypothetical protein [Cellvibrio sp.]
MIQDITPRTNCIICNNETTATNPFSDEHLIPEFLGGGLELKQCICKNCNSRMGADFEGRLSNSFLITSFRHTHNIKGKANILKSPFQGVYNLPDGTKFRVTHNHTLEALTSTIEGPDNNLRVVTDQKNTQDLESVIKKKIHRKTKYDPHKKDLSETINNIISSATHTTIENPEITINIDIDLNDFDLLFTKITFEAQFYFLGDHFLSSKDSAQMATALQTCKMSPEIKIDMPLPEENILNSIFDSDFHWIHKQNKIIFIKIHPFSGIVYLNDSNIENIPRTLKFCYKTQSYEEVNIYNQLAREMRNKRLEELFNKVP